MKAWLFTGAGNPLTLVDREVPEPQEDQVVVDVKAAGLCHSDVGFMHGDIDWMLAHSPIVLGHEVAGIVTALGPGVTKYSVGDRVGIAGLGLDAPGLVADGGFGHTVIGKVEQLVRIPESVSYAQAAAGTDAGQTSRHALRVGGVQEGSRVGIIGLGGLGLTGARISVLLGAEVYAAEVNEDVWPLALERGVKKCVRDVEELAEFELDIIVDFAGFGTTTVGAIRAISPGGRIVQVGLGRTEALIPTDLLVTKQVQLLGSLGGSLPDTEDVYRLMETGELELLVTPITFDEIPDGLRRLEEGVVTGRLIAIYGE